MTLTDKATHFSTRQFSRIQQQFSQTITWEIVGEQRLSGFDQVLKHCQSIEHFFTTAAPELHIQAIHQTGHHVIVQGEAQFLDAKQ
ncbi:nuclear transport factor 2 family protein, partial [Acinetobacter johnsonii]|uniref:nuclear transport factor 2 family protein n=1 Tax=Acinetobacter johnsonii TaxID=40214 RepID=UPI003AF9455F